MQELQLKVGTQVIIGKPINPMPPDRSYAITKLVSSIDGILEAHLPHCFIPGMTEKPAQVLVIILKSPDLGPRVFPRIGQGLGRIIPKGEGLDIIPLELDSPLMPLVRKAGCEIFVFKEKPKKPWWRFW